MYVSIEIVGVFSHDAIVIVMLSSYFVSHVLRCDVPPWGHGTGPGAPVIRVQDRRQQSQVTTPGRTFGCTASHNIRFHPVDISERSRRHMDCFIWE